MLVSDLFTALSIGELTNLSMSGNGSGTIITAQQPKIIRYANEALLALYARFPLKENDVLVQLYEHITFYHLIPRFALQYATPDGEFNEPIRYLLDLPQEPFRDEVLKVVAIYDGKGKQLPLNDEEKHDSLFTPQAKVLQVPNPLDETFINVRYQQRHRPLTGDVDQYVACPEVLLGALTSYIAYKVFSHMNTADSNAKAQEFMGTYEALCNEATDRDLVSTSISQSNTRFCKGGWI
jgi:hypothetical protein